MYLTSNTFLQGGKYKIVCHISSGGFGNTYEALDVNLDKRVAIKEFFVKDFCSRASDTTLVTITNASKKPLIEHLRKKFWEEARAIANMEHDNIVKVQALFEENDTAYYVMDFIDGESVHNLLKRRGSLPEKEALPIILKIADALGYMHEQNRFHLDVKPANIMLRKDGKVVLIDFGSSKQYAEVGGENTTTLAPCYTPGYAPSEQMNPKHTAFTAATDIYSLGATLYKMLTGLTPPSAIDLQNEDEELSPLPSEISSNVRTAVENAMIPQRKKRTKTIKAFLADLKATTVGDDNEKTRIEEEALRVEEERRQKEAQERKVRKQEERKAREEAERKRKEEEERKRKEEERKNGIFTVNGVTFKMIKVAGGTFEMKERVSSGFLGMSSKEIVQITKLSDYRIGETQVTQALWQTVMGKNPSMYKGSKRPVECVSWNDCQKFIVKLNTMTGKHFRLPTEAEWEFAARGGNYSKGYEYSGSNNLDDVAWYDMNSGDKTHDVATKKPNELGLYDMSGNVWEWCSDWYGNYSDVYQIDPIGPISGYYRVNRGGGRGDIAASCRILNRSGDTPNFINLSLGFRLALSE